MAEPIILNNRYRLEARLGSGGMAMVYRAQDLMLERSIAIKVLRKDYSKNPKFRTQFRQEAKAAANLSHPNIVTVHDFGFFSNQLYIVMEYVPGIDLKSLLKQRGRLDTSETIELITQACSGIGYAHRAGLVHCDVKPQNMLVSPDKRLKVVDFGIARALSTISPQEQADVVWGSPQYFSPEQASGAAPSPASDVYSLGVILFELLTGRLPFLATTPEELARLHRETLPPSPRKFNPNIPVPLEQILLKVLAKEPSARYRTADQLGRVLQNFSRNAIDAPKLVQIQPPQQSQIDEPISKPKIFEISPPHNLTVEKSGVRIITAPSNSTFTSVSPRRNNFDWLTWLLALLVFIALGGLIPFWLWVYYILNPPL